MKSCIHCHQVGDAQRQWYRDRKGPFPEKVIFPYPHPKSVGLILDPKQRASILRLVSGSPAEQAGFRPGDVLLKLEGQPILSIADVQWVLHNASPDGAAIHADIRSGARTEHIVLTLPKGWRQRDDISWRASSWGYRRMVTGGMLLGATPPEHRRASGLPDDGMALTVEYVAEYSPHDVAKRAGFRKGDIITSVDGKTTLNRESDVFAYALNQCKPDGRVPVTVLRAGTKLSLDLPMSP